MVDWGLVAVVIAVLAYPLQVLAIPPFIRFFGRAGGWLYRHIWPAAGQCTALEWTDFSSRPWHGTESLPQAQCCELNSNDLRQVSQLLFSGSWEPALSLLFPEPWRKAVIQDKVSKPQQLSTTTQYIRTDPAVLLLYVYFSALCCPSGGGSDSRFNHFVQLTEKKGVLVAQMRSTNDYLDCEDCQDACTKLCSITQTVKLFENREDFPESLVLQETYRAVPQVEIKMYPTDSRASWRRGGWVVAVGICSRESVQSSPLLRPILRNDLVKSSFRYAKDDQYMMLPEHVDDALQRVIHTLDDLNEVFHDKHLEDALAMTEQFRVGLRQYLTRSSRLRMVLNKSPLFRDKHYISPLRRGGWGEMDSRSIDTYEFVIKLFDGYRDLTSDEKEKLKPILEEVCRTAVIGMIRVFHFYKHGSADPRELGTIIKEPTLLKKYKHVYLEDR
ncbi:hypothetical protein F4821DRAFT_93332 [Hypoxylon rubiginosum]|uniref:Uncharacterized protein n=1 Tax=Hypoxylon rubiginosum TaxID=110542 RepID=A0ACC0D6E7_9PEZI|nr:hypothetical protein F4821DRAFT_93332 [Hypoxylon rubiginosum]